MAQKERKLNQYGFDELGRFFKKVDGKYNINPSGYHDRYGFDVNGIHKKTKTQFDEHGFDRDGIHKDTKTEFDSFGFKRDGIYYELQEDGTYLAKGERDPKGYNINGFDQYYFARNGFYQGKEGELYNSKGFKQDGTYRETGAKYNEYKFTIAGINLVTGSDVDIRGFTFKGRFRAQGSLCYRFGKLTYDERVSVVSWDDEWGFMQDGTHRITGETFVKGYNCFGVDENGRMKDGKLHPDLRFAIAYIKGMQLPEKDNQYLKFVNDYIQAKLRKNVPGVTADDYMRILLEGASQMYPPIRTSIILANFSNKQAYGKVGSDKKQPTER